MAGNKVCRKCGYFRPERELDPKAQTCKDRDQCQRLRGREPRPMLPAGVPTSVRRSVVDIPTPRKRAPTPEPKIEDLL